MVCQIILLLIALLGVSQGNKIDVLNFMCTPCLTFNGYYCHDNPWEVNYNGDKCFEHKIDRLNCEGKNFFSNDIKNCTEAIMASSGACVKAMDSFFNAPSLPLDFEMVLEPRSSCGFSVYGHDSILTVEHVFPLMMYHDSKLPNEYVNERNITTAVWSGKRDEPGNCLHSKCSNEYKLNDAEMYFFFANWDIDKNRTVTLTIDENSAYKRMSLLPILIVSLGTLMF